MATKEQLVTNIKDWMKVDHEMKALQKELKERRIRKKELTDSLVHIMKNNEIDCFDLSEGKIMYTKNNVKAPLSKKHLLTCLGQYFSEIPGIQSDEVANYILENREVKTKEGIRHKP
jgi:hypothetical protein